MALAFIIDFPRSLFIHILISILAETVFSGLNLFYSNRNTNADFEPP